MTTRAYISWTPAGGQRQVLQFDVVTDEIQEGAADVTEHPVEQGPNVSDHVRPLLNTVSLEGYISNEPLFDTGGRGAALKSIDLDVKTYVAPLAPTPGALFSALGGAISKLFGGSSPIVQASVLKFNSAFDAVSDTWALLETLRKTGQLLTVYTTVDEYDNMVLIKNRLPRDAGSGTGGRFSLDFKQIRLVQVALVTAPVPTEKRAVKKVDKGPQGPKPDPTPAQRKSTAKAAAQAAAARLGLS
jgi:hypothetical protein